MKRIAFFILAVTALMTACKEGSDIIRDFATEETIYPGKFDTIFTTIGYNRIELDLLKAGRIPSEQIKLGKAKKTVVEVMGEDEPRVWNEVRSWVSVDGLNESRLYRFSVYTIDEFENRSVAQEADAVPFTDNEMSLIELPEPTILRAPTSITFSWGKITNPMMKYVGLEYEYRDRDNNLKKGKLSERDAIFISMNNLNISVEYSMDVKLRVIPNRGDITVADSVPIKLTYKVRTTNKEEYEQIMKDKVRNIESISWKNCATIHWESVADVTQVRSFVTYIDHSVPGSPVEKKITVPREEKETILKGSRFDEPYLIKTVYSPLNADFEVETDEKSYHVSTIEGVHEIDRKMWNTPYSSVRPSSNTDGQGPSMVTTHFNCMYDRTFKSLFSIAKPGKSSNQSNNTIGRGIFFVVDMGEPITFNSMFWGHRDNDAQGVQWWALEMWGADEYTGPTGFTNPTTQAYAPDDTEWKLIGNVSFEVNPQGVAYPNGVQTAFSPPNAPTYKKRQTPVYNVPESTYRYIKVMLTNYNKTDANNEVGLTEFFLSVKLN